MVTESEEYGRWLKSCRLVEVNLKSSLSVVMSSNYTPCYQQKRIEHQILQHVPDLFPARSGIQVAADHQLAVRTVVLACGKGGGGAQWKAKPTALVSVVLAVLGMRLYLVVVSVSLVFLSQSPERLNDFFAVFGGHLERQNLHGQTTLLIQKVGYTAPGAVTRRAATVAARCCR